MNKLRRIRWKLRHPIVSLDFWWERTTPKRRLDRGPANLCMILGLIGSTVSILLQGPSPTSALRNMSIHLQLAMCACICIGLLIKMHGVLSGTRIWFPRKPLQRCYQLGYNGAPIASAGLFVYGFYLESGTPTWLSAVGAVLTPLMGLGVLLQGGVYWLESRRIERRRGVLIDIAKHQQEQS